MAGKGSEKTSKTWLVKLGKNKPFTMGGEPMTEAQALETARCIWANMKPESITVRSAT